MTHAAGHADGLSVRMHARVPGANPKSSSVGWNKGFIRHAHALAGPSQLPQMPRCASILV